MTLICTSCDEEVDELNWHDEDELCTPCFEVSGDSTAKYCCGSIYEEGEDTCKSCGEPL
jgi:hypothetical protein